MNGLSRLFGREGDGRRSLVGDLGVKVSARADVVAGLVRASGGEAWWVDDSAIAAAGAELDLAGMQVARECWAALAGVRLAARSGVGPACLVITGRAVGGDLDPVGDTLPGGIAESFIDVMDAVADLA